MNDAPLVVPPDQWYTPEIKRHSLEKIRLHNRYAAIFAAAMAGKWPQLAYVGLYSGAGHARVSGTNDTVETSALAVLRQPIPFTDYIFVDSDPRCVEALRHRAAALTGAARVTLIESDVNASASLVRGALPAFSRERGLLSFCFVDPFDLQLRFETIRALGALKMDFLVLLMLGVDGRRNFKRYFNDPTSTRIADFIDFPDWRSSYGPPDKPVRFILRRFDDAMQRIGYLSAAADAHFVHIAGMGVLQYALAFYSQHPLGQKFWRDTRVGVSGQLNLL